MIFVILLYEVFSNFRSNNDKFFDYEFTTKNSGKRDKIGI